MTEPPLTTVVEARGVLCPVPIIRLARAAAGLPAGALVELLSDDPAAALDVPAWCRLRGHRLLRTEPIGQEQEIAWRPSPAAPGPVVPPGPEPRVRGPESAQPLRHLIRVCGPAPGG